MDKVTAVFREWLSGHVLEPLFWKVKDLPVYKRYSQFKLRQNRSEDIFDNDRLEKLKKIAIHAVENIPYYSSLNINRSEIIQANTVSSVLISKLCRELPVS